MGARSKIEWTDSTWPVVTGCTPISPGCDNCYAARHARRFAGTTAWPNGFDVTLWPDRLDQPMRWRAPRKVFVCSTGDLFHDKVPDEYIAHVFAVMQSCATHTFITFCRDSPCCTTLCCSTPTRCGAAAASQTGCSPARQEARHELAGGASPGFRHSRGCGRDVVVWDVWCEDSFDGIWHLDGICGDIPTPYLVREHCLKCELVRVSPWCSECVLAYRHEQEQQFNNGEDRYLWCYACGQFSLDWQAVDASQEAGHPNQDRAN